MVSAGRLIPRARMLLLSAAFIILSVDMAVGRQCYWCGPLAEQVHRSRRAPPCEGGGRHITVCEPGYDYCAVVATSPPYLESRFCVKLYQDECYPLFCNSTKTWKMTCPCRGDLCNGANTEREEDAFAVLGKLVAKTHSHVKKRTPTLQLTGHRRGRIVNPEEQNDEPILADNSIDEVGRDAQIQKETSMETDKEQVTENDQPEIVANTESENISGSPVDSSEAPAENSAKAEITPLDNEETSASIQPSMKVDSENGDLPPTTSTVMIEIDIVHKPLDSDLSTQGATTIMQELDIQADEPIQNDQADVDMTKQEVEIKKPETTSDPPKPETGEIKTTPPTDESSANLDDNMDANHLKPESTVQKDASPPEPIPEQPKETAQTITDPHTISTMAATTANPIIVKTTTTSNNNKSSKDKNKKNSALRLSINTMIIIQYILICSII